MKAPAFWDDPRSPLGRALEPIGWIYAQATARRLARATPWKSRLPVICVGNLTAGGAGKTPVVRAIAGMLATRGARPAILSRGYGGRLRGPIRVDPAAHSAADVGDEPLMLAQGMACWIARDRAEGARAIAASDADAIVMDDGLQNPDLAQDLRLIVVDGLTGFGNGRVIPAGPLRETVTTGIARADALIVLGQDRHSLDRAFSGLLPVIRARLRRQGGPSLAGMRVIAFAGIGYPGKFKDTLEEGGARIVAFHGFPDHHPYAESELKRLANQAAEAGAVLLTTEKDWIRLNPFWRTQIAHVPVALQWDDDADIALLIEKVFPIG
jgi:tetraacyldisaccharide 4'-kinase